MLFDSSERIRTITQEEWNVPDDSIIYVPFYYAVGKYVMSNQKGGTYAKFDNSKRKTKFDEAIRTGLEKPGPGYYKASS